jgi:DNA-binding MarR family transcriptional regulator
VPTATRIVDRLEERGLAARSPDGRDRRVVWVEATPSGGALASEARRFRRRVIVERLRRLDPSQREALGQALGLLEGAIGEPLSTAR